MLARMRTLVVVPTYNEASGIETALRRIREVLPDGEILVVDDNSPDGTAELVEAARAADPGVSLLRRPAKNGLGSAYLAGFAEGLERGFDILVEMDADLSHDPARAARAGLGGHPRGRRRHRVALRGRRLDAGLDLAAGVPVALGQPVRRAGAGPRRERLDVRLPGLPGRRPRAGSTSATSGPTATASRSR